MTVNGTADGPWTDSVGDQVVSAAGLRMRYGEVDVLDDITFEIARGEVVTLLGPNGAGKTTTIEILEGFRVRSAGDVRVLDQDPAHADQRWRARTGVVLQSWRDHARWTPRGLLRHLGRYYLPYATELRPRPWDADELIALVGLADHADQKIGTLSGGERKTPRRRRRRHRPARAAVPRRADSGFDPEARREFHDLVHRLSDLEDTTILLTTHDLDEAEKLADRILILAGGHIVADGSADALARQIETGTEVRWSRAGERFVHSTADATAFVRSLFEQFGDEVADLDIRRATLEDTYISLVRRHEAATGGYEAVAAGVARDERDRVRKVTR